MLITQVVLSGFSTSSGSFGFLSDYMTGRRKLSPVDDCNYDNGAAAHCCNCDSDSQLQVTAFAGWCVSDAFGALQCV